MNLINTLPAIGSYALYTSVLISSIQLYGAEHKKTLCCISSSVLFILYIVSGLWVPHEFFALMQVFNLAVGIISTAVSLKGIKPISLIMIYFSIYLITIILISTSTADCISDRVIQKLHELFICITVLLCCIFISYTRIKQRIKYVLRLTSPIIKDSVFVLLACCAFLSISILNKPFYNDILWSRTVKVIFIFLLVLMALLILSLVSYSTSNKHFKRLTAFYKKQIEKQSEYYIRLSESNFRLRKFRHDFNNMFIGITTLLEEGRSEEALEMLKTQKEQLTVDVQTFDTGCGIADAILNEKSIRAKSSDTVIEFEGALPSSGINPCDICLILGNPLDNAIEACEKITGKEKKIIHVSCVCSSGFLFLDITNPVDKPVKFIGKMPVSSKNNSELHGIGLYSLELAVFQYNGELKLSCDNKEFKVSISLQIPETHK